MGLSDLGGPKVPNGPRVSNGLGIPNTGLG